VSKEKKISSIVKTSIVWESADLDDFPRIFSSGKAGFREGEERKKRN
jgi:hypothetical protein